MKTELKKNMPYEEYDKIDACHKSALKNTKTAKHLKKFKEKPKDGDALRFGKIFHTALLEPHLMEEYEIYDVQEWIPKGDHPESIAINDQKKAWKAEREYYYKNEAEKTAIENMVKAVLANPLAKRYLSGDLEAEPSLFWEDPTTGLACKTRLDILRHDDIIVEVKTDVDPEPEAFGKKFYNFDYHVGAWFNREGFRQVFGRELKAFIVIVVEKSDPHSVAVYMISSHDFEAGEIDAYPSMKRYQIIKQGGYQDHNQGEDGEYSIMFLDTPGWIVRKVEAEGDDGDEPTIGGEL